MKRPTKRNAFTLIELLVVITIIAILMTLTLQVAGQLIDNSRESATKATISKIQGLINQRAQGMERLMMRGGYMASSNEFNFLANAGLTASQQKIIATKLIVARYFPQRVVEIDPMLQGKLYAGYCSQFGLTSLEKYNAASDPHPELRSIEILYDSLTQTSTSDTSVGLDAFSAVEVIDSDGNGFPEFTDGWGHPLRFYRWPTQLFRPGGEPAPLTLAAIDPTGARLIFSSLPVFTGNLMQDLARDPDDPLQDCLTGFQTSVFENMPFAIPVFSANGQSVLTYRTILMPTPATFHTLLVVSAGQDGQYGMYATEDTANGGHLGKMQNSAWLTDDIVSMGIRAGGK